jgi:predicted nucleic-acid-binding protein
MSKKFVDTNIFIEVFARNGDKSDKCKKLFEQEDDLYTTMLVVTEVEWVLRAGYEVGKSLVVRCLKKILASEIEIENKKLLIRALDFYENERCDWTDCVNMFRTKEEKITHAYSYDRGLSKFDWIKRLEP